MKIKKYIALVLLLVSLLAITVASQISQTSTISVEEPKTCNTVFYDELQPAYGICSEYYDSTLCLNSSGPNTDCSLIQIQKNFTCKVDDLIIKKNLTECESLNKFIVSIDKGALSEKKEIDFSNWGVCVKSTENGCLAITCGTLKGGSARNGVFNGCDGGKSCQKFRFCEDRTEVLYKASRNDFVSEDPTFHLSSLALKEVGQ